MAIEQVQTDGPFHRGELDVQERLGVRTEVDLFARRAIRDYLPDQHRAFYANLPFLLLGAVDRDGRPWASMIAGEPGFVTSPDQRKLAIAARPLFGDPILNEIQVGADVGVLGLDPATRRRNRITGRIGRNDSSGFSILVDQSFGNCPQYIQERQVQILAGDGDGHAQGDPRREVFRSDRFDESIEKLLQTADTLFIATAFRQKDDAPNQGADVSHRGGRPGFIRIEDDRTFIFPDFAGNRYFNTLGNIAVNPSAGFLFPDFQTGNLVYMTGQADVVWDGPSVRNYNGAERFVRFRAAEVLRVEKSMPFRFTFGSYSPALVRTGNWLETTGKITADS
ncbi:flavin-nucleotide-binding protein [Hwanghaeella grinnelliae]|uniref:Flavin-nucleotide-binding protein n=1 Tax=Hwanghaeella grinnelliae TaxID=2500179 RepID=A0A3S2W5L4_9PROT|nr:pyridoxamine 5'-phosphate oxidase family protein [Hwanghaeella grinnelliae]RVU37758.1 flavin-nucleotide-binding protein [Hwanghaeella grinnelliae]